MANHQFKRLLRAPLFNSGLRLEVLESRCLLTVSSALVADVSGGLVVDPEVYDPTSILVRYKDVDGCHGAECAHALGVTESLGGQLGRGFAAVPGLHSVRLGDGQNVEQALTLYRNDPNVLYAEPDYRVHANALPNDPLYAQLWGLNNIGQTGGTIDADADVEEAWDVSTDSSIVVAVIDTGVDYTHEDLAANMWVNPGEIPGDGIDNDGNGFVDDVHGYDFFNDDGDPMDDHRHGTHVAGSIGAVGNNGIGVVGVNWNIEIMGIKFLDASGNGSTSDAIEAIGYAVANGASISNASWGGNEPFSQSLYDAIADAGNAGHILVAGAGNGDLFGIGQNNDANPFYPASYDLDNIISVAATDHNDNRATFSNYGLTSVDLAGPGVDILSTTPGNNYEVLSGTSMATPHVAGVASLVWQQNPTWTFDQVIDQLLGTVVPLPSLQGITTTGGSLNAAAAMGNPVPPPPPPPPGTLPILEDFQDNLAEFFDVRSGTWSLGSGRFSVSPTVDDPSSSGVSTVRVDGPLPADLEVRATVNAAPEIGFFFNYSSNGYVIFDYQNEFDFKFAGLDVSGGGWVIGQRTLSGWQDIVSMADASVSASTNYELRLVVLNDTEVTLHALGVPILSHTFAEAVNDGEVGLGVRNSVSNFDNVQVQAYVPPSPGTTLPTIEDFEDDVADHFWPRTAGWAVADGGYHANPFVGVDAISTIQVDGPLPSNLDLRSTISVDPAGGSQYSNALLIFDYQSNVDFKFAGVFAGANTWVIGHRTHSSWITDVSSGEAIDAGTQYQLQLVAKDDGSVTLNVDGAAKTSHSFAESLTDGEVGIGTWNAIGHFDDVSVQAYVPPPPPPSATLPLVEDFSDGTADFFQVQVGSWSVSNDRYHAIPAGDAISTLSIGEPLVAGLGFQATVNLDPAVGGFYSNAFLIFDYQSPTDFKFAGAYAGSNTWVIGHRSGSWTTDVLLAETVNSDTDYELQLVLDDDHSVTLNVDGETKLGFSFADSVTDGELGIGTWNAISDFDDVRVQAHEEPPPPPSDTLPVFEDFSDGIADLFQPQVGDWNVSGNRYHDTPNGDAVSTISISEVLPTDLELQSTVNIEPGGGGFYSNAVLIFDYQSPTDFKFAGAYAGGNIWVIGHRSGFSWITDESFGETIQTGKDYVLQLEIENDSMATLKVDGVAKTSHTFTGSLTDGELGVGTWNALAHFDDISVQAHETPPPPAGGTLPLAEDFSDGIADFFQAQVGSWNVSNQRYHDAPAGDAISTLRIGDPLPVDLEVQATVNIDSPASGFYSNAVLIFDYQSPSDFKFAGAYAGGNLWVIGHRTAAWTTVASFGETINTATDYAVLLEIENDSSVTLSVNGVPKTSHNFGGSLTDGEVGVGTWNALAHFDDVLVQPSSTGIAALSAGGTVSPPPTNSGHALLTAVVDRTPSDPILEEQNGSVADQGVPIGPKARRSPEALPATSVVDHVFAALAFHAIGSSGDELDLTMLEDDTQFELSA